MCREVEVPKHKLMLFVQTRWASMSTCLDQALTLQKICTYAEQHNNILIYTQAITHFTQLADDSNEVPTLQNKTYSSFRMSKQEWDRIKLLYEVIKVSIPILTILILHVCRC
jgi:hypothetical protein